LADRVAAEERQRRLVAALAYLFTPLIPLLVLLTDMRRDAFLRQHAGRALLSSAIVIIGLVMLVIALIVLIRQSFLWICLLPAVMLVPFIPAGIWARRVYLYGDVRPALFTPLADRLFQDRRDEAGQ
jgi:uncharacterized membrane protein